MTDRNRRMMWTGTLLLAALLVASGGSALADDAAPVAAAPTATAPATSTDWPQWRGPTRDGIAPAGPKLLDSWPKEGPKRVWKSGYICAVLVEGGMSSPVVAEGKVIIYANSRDRKTPVVLVTSDLLKKWGWVEDMPEDLAKKLDEAMWEKNRKNVKPGTELDAYIKEFLAKLDPQLADTYREIIRVRLTNRFNDVHMGLPPWKQTAGFAKMKDKEYGTLHEAWDDISKYVGVVHNDNAAMYTQLAAEAFPCYDSIICLDAATGKELWRKDLPGAFKIQLGMVYWPASATPAISGGRCYVQGSAGFYCLSMKDGSVVWQTKTDFSHSSPLVVNDVVYAMAPFLTAYAAATGTVLWKQEKGPARGDDYDACTSVIPWKNGGKLSLITLGRGNAPYCFDPNDGKVIWETTKEPHTASNTPIIVGGMLVGQNCAFRISPQGAERIWTLRAGGDRASCLTAYEGHVYAHMGYGPWCFDLKTGAQKWKGPGYGGS